jgi:hypothetical protein
MDLNKLLKTQWDRAGAIGFTALGAIFLIAGWIGVSGTPYLAEQAPYILSGGVGGVFLLGLGATLWISADLRDEWRKLDRIETALGEGVLRWVEDDAPAVATPQRPARLEPALDVLGEPEVLPLPEKRAANGHAKAARTSTGTTTRRTPRVSATKASASDA